MDVISKYHDFEIIHGWFISILIYIYLNIVCILTWESNLFFLFSCVRFQGTTKDALVANVIQLVLEHCLLFTHHHVAKVV
jgi:hypothetical protein